MKHRYTVMSFNLRYNNERDGLYALHSGRFDFAVEYIRSSGADIIGFQEVEPDTGKMLAERLGDIYHIVGSGRGRNFDGEACPIAYRRDRFDLIGLDTFWLSPTPGVAASKPVKENCPRITTTVTLLPLEGDDEGRKPIRVYNTHLFHTPDEWLRAYGLYTNLDRIRADKSYSGYPVIFMGDFNSTPGSLVLSSLRKYPTVKLKDATAALGYTYHEYENPRLEKTKIDYIFTDLEYDPVSSRRVTLRREGDGMFLSDHYPVKVDVVV